MNSDIGKEQKLFKLTFAVLIVSVLLIGSGIIAGAILIRDSRRIVIQGQETSLNNLAGSADRNISNIIRKFQDDIYYISTRTGFQEAEQGFVEEGKSADLWFWLRDNSLTQNELVSAMIATQDGKTVLASHEAFREGYVFYESLGWDFAQLWKGPGDSYYMGITFQTPSRSLRYAALIDLEEYYRQVAGNEEGNADEILLFSERLDLLISRVRGEVRIDRLRDPESTAANKAGIALLQQYLEQPAQYPSVYELSDPENDRRRLCASVYPARDNENGIFTIAVLTDYESLIEPVNRTNVQLVLCLGIILLGVTLLAYAIARIYQDRRESDLELVELKQKNESMQELLEKTKEVEHIQRLETIGTMTSGIAHEFNNLLTPIMGYSIMTLEKLPEEDTELSDNIIAIYNASLKAKEVIQRLSDISRKNAVSFSTEISPDALMQKVLETSRPSKPKEVLVETDLNCNEVTITANETQMTQLFLNLIINAYHAMEEKGGTLTVCTRYNRFRRVVEFRIRDEGTGIPKEALPNIFDPFYTTKEAGKGSGLGLSIAKNIVEEHHGSIDVSSVEGAGTEFIIRIPEKQEQEKH